MINKKASETCSEAFICGPPWRRSVSVAGQLAQERRLPLSARPARGRPLLAELALTPRPALVFCRQPWIE
jgi:hypothetical protein